MAKQTGMYYLGRYGNIVASTWKGIPYLRSQPATIRQSQATRQSCNNMARASAIAAAFRKSFVELMPLPTSRSMQNRFTGVIKKWLQTNPFEQPLPNAQLPFITGFEFNEHAALQYRLRAAIEIRQHARQLLVRIPEFIPTQTIAAPTGTMQVQLKLTASCCNAGQVTISENYSTTISMAYSQQSIPPQDILLPFVPPGNSITLIVVALQYFRGTGRIADMITDLDWLPCGVVSAWVA